MGPMNIKTKPHEKQSPGFRWLILIAVLFCELLTHAWVRTESTQTILRISEAQAGIAKAMSYGDALSVERNRLKSDERITRIASTRLGLSTDTFSQTIYLSGENR